MPGTAESDGRRTVGNSPQLLMPGLAELQTVVVCCLTEPSEESFLQKSVIFRYFSRQGRIQLSSLTREETPKSRSVAILVDL